MTDDVIKRVNESLGKAMQSIEQEGRERRHKLAQENPDKYRLTTIMPNGSGYYYFTVLETKNPKDKRKLQERHSWIRFIHKNSAGFFLICYQIENDNKIWRSNWKAEKTRKDAEDFCIRMRESKRVLKKSEIIDNYNKEF
mgnify:CR=1 FL=1|tara:strand:- start:83 stop:502 length:420 start_codon:yes stop_codon:yes gene_type:complete